MVDRESHPPEDDAPVAPPIPSFDSLRSPRRRSAIDLLLPPAEPTSLVDPVEPADLRAPVTPAGPFSAGPRAPRAATGAGAAAPRPAEWGDLLVLGARLGGCVGRLLAGLRARLPG